MTESLALIVAIIGALVFILSNPENTSMRELGRISYMMGLLAFLLLLSSHIAQWLQ